MQLVSRDVIEHLSHVRVIFSERRYPSLGDISDRWWTRTNPFGRFRHVTAIPGVTSGGAAERPFGEMVPPSVGGAVNLERSRCRPRLDDGRRGSFEQNYMQQ